MMGTRGVRILENVLFFFLLVFLVSASSSVALSEIALGVSAALFAFRLSVRRGAAALPWEPPKAVLVAAAVWAGASILAVLAAPDRAAGAAKLLKLLPMGLLWLLPRLLFTGPRLRHALAGLLVGASITSAYGIGYYLNDPSTRLGGFIGFYMTTSGILLEAALLGFAVAITQRVGGALRAIAWGTLPVLLVALVLTDTRGAWMGLLAGLFVLVLLTARRLALLPVALLALLLVLPGKPRQTALSVVDPHHPRNRERVLMWKAGLAMFRDRPWTGIGLAGVERAYLDYRDPAAVEKAPHLHSVPIHILASMGIAGFAAWILLFGSLLAWLVRALREARRGPPVAGAIVAGAIAVWAGFVVNGFVEWNLGDLEVVTFFWAVMGLGGSASVVSRRFSLPEDLLHRAP
jgi:putative inorganic carbon (HCO3(-)) transporter